MADECTCRFVSAGQPMNNEGCEVHDQAVYKCDDCGCGNYRPAYEPKKPHWPICECGHAAQAHNS